MKKIGIFEGIMLGLCGLYICSTFLMSNTVSNIISLATVLASLFVMLNIRKDISKKNLQLFDMLLLLDISFCIGEFIDLVVDFQFRDINKIPVFLDAFYLLPNIILVIFACMIIYKYYDKRRRYQIMINIGLICAILVAIFWSFIFSKYYVNPIAGHTVTAGMVFYIYLDFYILIGICYIFFSLNFKERLTSICIATAGLCIYVFSDFIYAYHFFRNSFKPNRAEDILFIIGIVLITVGIAVATRDKTEISFEYDVNTNINLRRSKVISGSLVVFFLVLFIFRIISFNVLAFATGICVTYIILITFLRESILDKQLLQNEVEMNKKLEKAVEQKTRELRKANEYLQRISNIDALTDLYNRRYLFQFLDEQIEAGNPFALVYIDINRFKSINDSYGHEVGDSILRELGERFRINDNEISTFFRLGGDDFAVVISNIESNADVVNEVERILSLIEAPVYVDAIQFNVTASAGVSLYPDDADEKFVLMRHSDIAMYHVKHVLKNQSYMFFNNELGETSKRRHQIELLLRSSDFDDSFYLVYQPQFNIDGTELIGMEALIRWNHPKEGIIYPNEFIPVAEETGLIVDIGEWVMKEASRQIAEWNRKYNKNLSMSINISSLQLDKKSFMDDLNQTIIDNNMKRSWIDLEITERSAVEKSDFIEHTLRAINVEDISVSIDDFGTGYSSLSYLKRYNINRIKIAKELVDNICDNEDSLMIISAIIMMAKGLNLLTIAEGVETKEQLEILKEQNCDQIQGYYFGRPVEADKFEELYFNGDKN